MQCYSLVSQATGATEEWRGRSVLEGTEKMAVNSKVKLKARNLKGSRGLSSATMLRDVQNNPSCTLCPKHGAMKIPTVCGDVASAEHVTCIS